MQHTAISQGLDLSDLITTVMTVMGIDINLLEKAEDGKSGHFPISPDRPMIRESLNYIIAGYFVVNGIGNGVGYENPLVIWGDVDVTHGGTEMLSVTVDPAGQVQFALAVSC